MVPMLAPKSIFPAPSFKPGQGIAALLQLLFLAQMFAIIVVFAYLQRQNIQDSIVFEQCALCLDNVTHHSDVLASALFFIFAWPEPAGAWFTIHDFQTKIWYPNLASDEYLLVRKVKFLGAEIVYPSEIPRKDVCEFVQISQQIEAPEFLSSRLVNWARGNSEHLTA